MKNKIGTIIFALMIMGLSSCSDWLDVKPKTTVDEEELFSREVGFVEALAGIYMKMATTDLYARNLSYGFLDILAQRYDQSQTYRSPLYYEYPSIYTDSYTTLLWRKMYNEIANVNNLLHWLDKNPHVFTTPDYYEIIKGEAYALRAFLHFDLLRMYGPVYAHDPGAKRISYRTEFGRETQEMMPSNLVVEKILKDLEEAEKYLKESDPLIFNFPIYDDIDNEDIFLKYRYTRMNLYAVKAMLARVHLYAGNKTEAAVYAKEVIDSRLFAIIDDASDPLRSRELIFTVDVYEFDKQIQNDFFEGMYRTFYIRDEAFLMEIFDEANDGRNDSRLKEGIGFQVTMTSYTSLKYRQSGLWVSVQGLLPLIKLPEMYYILAECEMDYEQSAKHLNVIRESRGVEPVFYRNEAEKLYQIEKEYRKEFYGEGQLWYFYKRHGYETFLHCPVEEMVDKNYIFNWPENEELFGKTN